MKQGLAVFLLFWVLTIPTFFDLFHPGLNLSHDGDGHVIRLVEFDNSLSDGNFPPRWAKRLNYGLGYPFFNFDYPLIYAFGDIFHKIGLSFIDSTKALFLLSFPLSGFFAYLWLRSRFNLIPSLAGGLIYTISPYHFLNVYVRGDLGEVIALTLVPLAFYCLERIRTNQQISRAVYLSLVIAAIIASHNLTALVFLPLLFVYGLIVFSEKRSESFIKNLIFSFDLGLFLSCFFWLPALFDRRYIVIDQVLKNHIAEHFVKFSDLIFPSWGYNLPNRPSGEMSFQVGLVNLGIILAAPAVMTLMRKRVNAHLNSHICLDDAAPKY